MKSRRFIQNLERIANMTQRRGQLVCRLKFSTYPSPALLCFWQFITALSFVVPIGAADTRRDQ
jgi:hypothetical protein